MEKRQERMKGRLKKSYIFYQYNQNSISNSVSHIRPYIWLDIRHLIEYPNYYNMPKKSFPKQRNFHIANQHSRKYFYFL